MKPPRIERGSALLGAALAIMIVMYFFVLWLAQSYEVAGAPAGSTFSSAPEGFRVLFNYLDGLGLEPRTLETWEELPRGATIVSAGPYVKDVPGREALATARWVEGGGRLVLVGSEAYELARTLPAAASPVTADPARPMSPLLPGPYSRGVRSVDLGSGRLLADNAAWVTHYKDLEGQGLLSQAVGDGEVVWLASRVPMSNAGIGKADNARLATLLAYRGRPVYFDEYHHGFVSGGGIWDRMGSGGRSAAVLLAVALAIAVIAVSRRLGPPIAVPERRGSGARAYIPALAELYRKAGARPEALASLEEGLKRALARRHGTLAAGITADRGAAEALAVSSALRSAGEVPPHAFIDAARSLCRARREVEGRHA